MLSCIHLPNCSFGQWLLALPPSYALKDGWGCRQRPLHSTSQISCSNCSFPAKWDVMFASLSVFPAASLHHMAKTMPEAFIKTDMYYFSGHYSKKTAASQCVRSQEFAPETSILLRGSCDRFDRLPRLKCPSVDRLQRSHVCQEHRAEWVMGPGLWDQVPGGSRRYGAITLTVQRAHTRGVNSNCHQPNDRKVNQRKGVNCCKTCDG